MSFLHSRIIIKFHILFSSIQMKKQLFQHVVEKYGDETRMEEVGSASLAAIRSGIQTALAPLTKIECLSSSETINEADHRRSAFRK